MSDTKQNEFIQNNIQTLLSQNELCLQDDSDTPEERDALLKRLSPWYNSALPLEVQNVCKTFN